MFTSRYEQGPVLSVQPMDTSVRNLIATTSTPSLQYPPKSDVHFSIRALPVQPGDTSVRNLIATIATSSHHNLPKRNVHLSRRNGFRISAIKPTKPDVDHHIRLPYSCSPQLRHQNSRTALTLASPDTEPIFRKPPSHTGLRASTNQERNSAPGSRP